MRRTKLIASYLAVLSAVVGSRAEARAAAPAAALVIASATSPTEVLRIDTPPPSAIAWTTAVDQDKPAATTEAAQTPPKEETAIGLEAELPKKAPPTKGMTFKIGDSSLKVGGYVKVDLKHDFDRISSVDFDPRTIDTTGLDGEDTTMTARESRLNLDFRTPTDMGELKVYLEGDFAGTSNAFRLRHAYGEVDHILGGQTWSTFMDEGAMPETLDFESPIAFPLKRQAQIRYTQRFEDGNYMAFSVEDPDNSLTAPPGVPGVQESPIPDLNARFHFENERGHVQVGLFGGMTKFQPDVGSSDNVSLWGVNLAAKERTFGDDYAVVQLTTGDGVGRYRGGVTAAPDAAGNMEAVRTNGWTVGYQHKWSDKYRSTLTYADAKGDLPSGAAPDANEALTYMALNLIWQFTGRAWVGIEYLHGSRDTFDGSSGDADRLQMSLRFDI